ncbi:hypothetical protein SAMN05216223_10549 [Actinacidiphila yanglinensis]|uniref:PT repeat-containing protein n=1 Tax=Actinacidiphila yanglinensis TaxID=310779 RepID=A0A1H5ZZA1_9ACTN|nr:hypothetical protein [Actinacidiphila yanglinensis]SEG41470.1 hypothetical protein SAMN05216223_10549 [Actinacidiphila yanglinensis]
MNWTTSRPPAARIAVRAGAFVAVIASGALALTACSSGGSSSADAKASGSASASAAASGGGANGADMNAYRQCLSQHGVNLPTFKRPSGGARPSGAPSGRPSGRPSGGFGGGFGGGGGIPGLGGASPDAATQKALKACASKAPKFNGRGGQGANSGADASAIQAFTGCLKDHGVTLPTPSAGASGAAGGRGAFGELRNLNTADPKTAKAYDTCKALLPQRPSSSPS